MTGEMDFSVLRPLTEWLQERNANTMAGNKANTGATEKLAAPSMAVPDWESLLEDLNSKAGGGGSGNIYYIKREKTRVRLVLVPGRDPRRFFVETQKIFQNKTSLCYLVPAVVLSTNVKDDQYADPLKVKWVRVPKTLLPQIVALIVEGFEIFHPTEGHGITIDQIKGERTSYMVRASPKPVALDWDNLVWPDETLETASENEIKKQEERAAQGDKGGRRVTPQAVEDDEDLPF